MQRVRDYLHRHYAREDCNTHTLARRLRLSCSALCHRYREAFGSSIGRDVRALRMRRACELLQRDPDRLFKEVAAEVGYSHANYRTFHNAFRTEVGMSPRRFADRVRLQRLAARLRQPVSEEVVSPSVDRADGRGRRAGQSRIRSA